MVTDEQLAELEQWILSVGWSAVQRFANGVGGICEPSQLHLLKSSEASAVLMGLAVQAGGGRAAVAPVISDAA